MKKYFRIAVLTFLAVGLMSAPAFAAASLNAGNTTMASELVPAAGLLLPGVNTGYQTNGPVAATSQLKISLTNGTFTAASTVAICDGTVAVLAPNGVISADLKSMTITLAAPLASGTVYNFQPAACLAGVVPLNNVNVAAGVAGGAPVSMTIDNALTPGDPNVFASATILTLMDQFSVAIEPVKSTITFASGMKLLNGVTTSSMNYTILSNETIATRVATGLASNTVCAPMGAGAGKELKYTVTPESGFDFSGIAAATGFGYTIAGAGFTVLDAAIVAADASASGTADTPLFMVCGTAASDATKALAANKNQLVLTVDGTTVLTPRKYDVKIETATGAIFVAAPRTLLAATKGWEWALDSSQYYIPLVGSKADGSRETYIKLQSKNTSAVSIAILANDGTTTATWTGTITKGVPLTVTGADLVAAATTAGKTVDGAAGFAVIVTVNAAAPDVFAYANMIDAAGAKRIPVKTVGGTIVE